MADQAIVRVGLVGCGFHGRALAEAVTRTASMRLVACVDPDDAAARQVARLAESVVTHQSIEQLLAETQVDAVIVATPHDVLVPASLSAASAGKHVLVEKPMAMSDSEAATLEETAGRSGICLMVGYSMRFSMGRRVRQLLDAGVVGEPVGLTGAFTLAPLNSGWTADPRRGGGALLYVGCHVVDMALWFLQDEVVEVFAQTILRRDTQTDDTSAFQMHFARGAVAQCLVTQSAPGFSYEVVVHGTSGRVALRGRNMLQFDIEVLSSAVAAYAEPTVIRPVVRRDNITMMLVPELEEFAAAIEEGRAPSIAAVDGRKVLRVLDALTDSSKAGKPITLPSWTSAAHSTR